MGMECIVYMGQLDMERQRPNVERMRILGAKVVPATCGNMTLKDATNEAMRHWINHPTDTHYIIGSVVGPHPYPDMVTRFQSVISDEIRKSEKALQRIVEKAKKTLRALNVELREEQAEVESPIEVGECPFEVDGAYDAAE